MGEHKRREGVKGDSYKSSQRITKRGRYVLIARLSDKWWQMQGFVKDENGKWIKA